MKRFLVLSRWEEGTGQSVYIRDGLFTVIAENEQKAWQGAAVALPLRFSNGVPAYVHNLRVVKVREMLDAGTYVIFDEGKETKISLVKAPQPCPESTWWAYECFGRCAGKDTGVVLDVRVDNARFNPERERCPEAMCPVCGGKMTFRGCWAADELGYGSRGDELP